MIICKTEHEISLMRAAGKIVAETHQLLAKAIKPGITTHELDQLAEAYIKKQNAFPSFLGYGGFPASICASVNEELVHGIPSERVLKEGDIISIDIGAEYMGFHADSAWTYPVGEISENAKELLRVTEESLYKGLAEAMPDNRLSDISHAIGEYIVQNNYSVVREYVGHGIGEKLHEDPHIPNYGPPHRGPRLKVGMALAIEPMVIEGERYVRVLDDDWTVVSLDKSLCAHYEHTIVITNNGYEIMTKL